METAKEKFLKEVEGILNDNGLEELMDEIIDDDISDVLWNVEDLRVNHVIINLLILS